VEVFASACRDVCRSDSLANHRDRSGSVRSAVDSFRKCKNRQAGDGGRSRIDRIIERPRYPGRARNSDGRLRSMVGAADRRASLEPQAEVAQVIQKHIRAKAVLATGYCALTPPPRAPVCHLSRKRHAQVLQAEHTYRVFPQT
jgi:hypothetical protein